jgi:hypothetical protein
MLIANFPNGCRGRDDYKGGLKPHHKSSRRPDAIFKVVLIFFPCKAVVNRRKRP